MGRTASPTSPREGSGAGASARVDVAGAASLICPYLVAGEGGWRRAVASRDQACGAVEPAVLLALDKQRRLCLGATHGTCPTYAAAVTHRWRRSAGTDEGDGVTVTRWALVRTSPVVLDRVGGPSLPDAVRGRGTPQLALGGVLALTLAALIVGRLPSTDASLAVDPSTPSPPAVATPGPTPAPEAAPSRTRPPTASPAVSASPSTPPPTATPDATLSPAPTVHTYRVASGDNLWDLSVRFGTTVAAIQEANGLTTTNLRVGQVLVIP